ncbi:hypothetical protein L3Q82_004116 [Scortum barcoo]|uniref:Uncharacterized protein n=1 Tax=Scortum barcoo TaxID=214431 RepID=A0ACB8X6Y6_9TELE|nr:hypothetical protein L3Q82_004116 [Scortum barcoo]
MLACGTPDAVDRVPAGQASRSPDGPGGKNFGSGRSLVRPWRRTIGRPRRDSGKPSGASEGGSSTLPTLFTVRVGSSTGDLDWGHGTEEKLLNPTGDSAFQKMGLVQAPEPKWGLRWTEVDSSSGSLPGVDEIRPG